MAAEPRARDRVRRSRHAPEIAVGVPPADVPAPARSQDLDGVIHERTRLGIVGALAANDRLSFVELKNALRTTDGNLSAHTRKLEDAGYISATKRFEGRLPRTEYELTEAGRLALGRYLDQMDRLLTSMKRRT
jgi:DNA-binding HxlR family transcriptional regulator